MITKTIKIKRIAFKETYTIGKCTVDGYMLAEVKTEPLSAREKLIKALEKSKSRMTMID